MDFRGRIAVITGASGGLGLGMLEAFGSGGATLVALDRVPPPNVAPPSQFFETDVKSSESVARSFASVSETVGTPDILVTCAGIREIVGALELSPDEWDNIIGVDLSGTFYCCQAAARLMVKANRGGSIITISSVAGLVGIANRPAYSAAKHGLIGLTRVLAKELAPYKIRANAIAPGLIRTPLTEAYCSDANFVKELAVTIPEGSYGEPADIANAAAFLASDSSRYITGSVVTVDGGFMAERSFSFAGSGSSAYWDSRSSTR